MAQSSTTNKTAHFIHFGCRLNQYESDAIKEEFFIHGIENIDDHRQANYIVINTCTVTNRADQKTRNTIRRLHRDNPWAKIIVTGCYATTDKNELEKLPGVTHVVSNDNKAGLYQLIDTSPGDVTVQANEENSKRFQFKSGVAPGFLSKKSRAYLKIQDGCNKKCSYCKIPEARGRAVSRNFQETLEEAKRLIDAGFQELVLTGVNIGDYQQIDNGYSRGFLDLLLALLEIQEDFKLRISSIEPADVTTDLAELMLHPKMSKFLHVPLQSGSDSILKLMRRGYTTARFAANIEKVRSKIPHIHIGTDVIFGFPGETIEQAAETMEFCRNTQFANIHIFPFSMRRKTHAEILVLDKNMPDIKAINGKEIKARAAQLSELKESMANEYIEQTSGLPFSAIIEKIQDNHIELLTENYVRLKGKLHREDTLNRRQKVQVKYFYDQNSLTFNII